MQKNTVLKLLCCQKDEMECQKETFENGKIIKEKIKQVVVCYFKLSDWVAC